MVKVHINIHIAVGLIIASIFNHFFGMDIFQFIMVVICAFIADFDILILKFSKEENHRMFFSHSLFPSIFIITFGIIFNSYLLIICGVAYLSHIFIDTIDWGTNLSYFQKKVIGFKFLISKEEIEDLKTYLDKYKIARSFFDFRYYKSKLMVALEIIFFLLMMVFMIFYALEFILLIILYFISFFLHVYTHYRLKAIEGV